MENLDIAKVFYEIADLLEIKGENPFRIRSYRNAALVIEGLPVHIKSIVERNEEELEEIPGIGESLHEKIVEILKTGKCGYHQELLKMHPKHSYVLKSPTIFCRSMESLSKSSDAPVI